MKKINIVNGMALYSFIRDNDLAFEGDVLPFNEAMCDGDATPDIFGSEFVSARCVVHCVGMEEYEEIVINQIEPLFSLDYDEIHLYFDEDMFCQINLLTLLAYMDRNEYRNKTFLHLIDKEFNELNIIEIKPQGFYKVYEDVLINKRLPECVLPEIMLDGVINYLDYSKDTNEITQFIEDNPELDENELLDELFNNFGKYGLGDTQLLKIISMYK